MARFRKVINVATRQETIVPFTASEEAAADIEEAQVSLNRKYAPTVVDARNRKRTEELKAAMVKFNEYQNSSPKITTAQLRTYKQTLSGDYDTAEAAILSINTGTVDGDVEAIRDFPVVWSDPT